MCLRMSSHLFKCQRECSTGLRSTDQMPGCACRENSEKSAAEANSKRHKSCIWKDDENWRVMKSMKSKASTSLDINNSWQNVPGHQEVRSNCKGWRWRKKRKLECLQVVGARDHGGPSGADHSQDFPQVHHLRWVIPEMSDCHEAKIIMNQR